MKKLFFLFLVLLSYNSNYCEGSGLLRAPNNREEAQSTEQGDREVSITSSP